MMTIKTQIPTPMMIRIRMSFHLTTGQHSLRNAAEDHAPHLLSDTVGAPSETLCRDGKVVFGSQLASSGSPARSVGRCTALTRLVLQGI